MSGRVELWLYVAQRLSAMVLAPLVIVHLGTMIYAIRDGLTAAEILGRTDGSILWACFYGLFVIAAAVHGAIGLRAILREMTAWRSKSLDVAAGAFCLTILVLGLRAVEAVT
jgi:succinate dehydrogenase subunit C